MLRVLLPMEKYKREQLLPLLQQLRACFCSALPDTCMTPVDE